MEHLNNSTPGQENYAEELVLETLTPMMEDIQTKFAADPQHDVNKHWAAVLYRVSLAIGKNEVDSLLAKKGWDKDTFPQE